VTLTCLRSKDLLGTEGLSAEEIALILDTAEALRPIGERPIKKVPALRGRMVVHLFFEASTRTRFSFDMLGEGARTARDAERNFARYLDAVAAVAKTPSARDAFGVSVKLSSIHPRYDAASHGLVRGELLARLKTLCRAAAAAGASLTIDAEESERALLQLDLFGELAADRDLFAWPGLGIALQAYRTQALEAVDSTVALARTRKAAGGASLCVRLVKGAYWDAEIKRAQELGLEDYPVFTDKRATDLSFLVCAKRLLGNLDCAICNPQPRHARVCAGACGDRGGVHPPIHFRMPAAARDGTRPR